MPYSHDLRCSYLINDDEKQKFENHIQEALRDWTVYQLLGDQRGKHRYESYENVLEFLTEIALKYKKEYPAVFREKQE